MTHSPVQDNAVPHAALPIGALDRAGNYAPLFKEAAALRASAPIFVAPIDESLADHMTGRAILRLGAIELPTGGVMLFFRMQRNDTQFIWLADATDQDVWRALDAFRKTGQAGFGFRSGEHVSFVPYETRDNHSVLEQFRSEMGRKDRHFLEAATAIIAYGDPAKTFETMRPGIKVQHYRVCILGTARVKAMLAEWGGFDVPVAAGEALLQPNGVSAAPATMQ